MIEELRNSLLEKISLIPGIYGFTSINSDESELLGKSEWDKSIIIIKGNNGLKINLAVIILFSINTKATIKEVSSLVEYFLTSNNLKLESLNIHVKGVKL
ncbi:Asp23/Gls24 family envelope stress response protein [Mesomycoplasma lagogenitalium]|uniref:Asp23/Gls24 family envelope stress response protein n=1 Tax=Mesomycoplasma lagogenitalium TaxID=171286 RepID=A0ABY8LSX6_9BACT|nr:Asp23/Gls24 family envelope stress response protein [Mesomycoplasma lagogenitalium]WGI36353.1 Asp23/Gls24 family envelope stress response protein [Mesomycoplasma lagogenitalium]